jgi:hypothetical protein
VLGAVAIAGRIGSGFDGAGGQKCRRAGSADRIRRLSGPAKLHGDSSGIRAVVERLSSGIGSTGAAARPLESDSGTAGIPVRSGTGIMRSGQLGQGCLASIGLRTGYSQRLAPLTMDINACVIRIGSLEEDV